MAYCTMTFTTWGRSPTSGRDESIKIGTRKRVRVSKFQKNHPDPRGVFGLRLPIILTNAVISPKR